MFPDPTYLGFCSDPKYFIVQNEQSIVKYGGNMVEKVGKYDSEAKYTYKKYKNKIKVKNV